MFGDRSLSKTDDISLPVTRDDGIGSAEPITIVDQVADPLCIIRPQDKANSDVRPNRFILDRSCLWKFQWPLIMFQSDWDTEVLNYTHVCIPQSTHGQSCVLFSIEVIPASYLIKTSIQKPMSQEILSNIEQKQTHMPM